MIDDLFHGFMCEDYLITILMVGARDWSLLLGYIKLGARDNLITYRIANKVEHPKQRSRVLLQIHCSNPISLRRGQTLASTCYDTHIVSEQPNSHHMRESHTCSMRLGLTE